MRKCLQLTVKCATSTYFSCLAHCSCVTSTLQLDVTYDHLLILTSCTMIAPGELDWIYGEKQRISRPQALPV